MRNDIGLIRSTEKFNGHITISYSMLCNATELNGLIEAYNEAVEIYLKTNKPYYIKEMLGYRFTLSPHTEKTFGNGIGIFKIYNTNFYPSESVQAELKKALKLIGETIKLKLLGNKSGLLRVGENKSSNKDSH